MLISSIVGAIMLFLIGLDRRSKNKIFCNVFGWHEEPEKTVSAINGKDVIGICPRCNKSLVKYEGKGKWYTDDYDEELKKLFSDDPNYPDYKSITEELLENGTPKQDKSNNKPDKSD